MTGCPLKGVNIPTTDVFTKDNNLVVEAHLPNFEQKDVNIEVENGALVISAERHEKRKIKANNITLCVKSSSSFYRRIALPKRADADKIEAHLNDGVLKVSVPLTPLPEPKKFYSSKKNSSRTAIRAAARNCFWRRQYNYNEAVEVY